MTKLLQGFVKDGLYLLEFLLQKEILGVYSLERNQVQKVKGYVSVFSKAEVRLLKFISQETRFAMCYVMSNR